MNQMYYRNIQGTVINEYDKFTVYISSFEDDKFPIEEHSFVQAQKKQF